MRGRALLGAILGLLLAAAPLSAAGQTGELSDVGERSFADVAACVANSDTLLVSMVVDQSGSLQNTDPANERVGAVDTAIEALEGLRQTASAELDVQMNLAVFDGSYEELVGWGSLAGDHAQSLRDAAARELPVRNTGDFTDYRAALSGAERSLTSRSEAVDPDACKVVLWFTDGRLDVGESTQAARAELCAPQGIADSLRGNHIAVVALALFTEQGRGAVSQEDANLLRAVAEGSADGVECGTTPVPESFSGRAYLRASDAAALRRVFAGAGTLIEGGQQALSVTCPGQECIEGQFRVPLDRGLSGFRLVLDGVQEDRPPVMRSPDGQAVELVSGTAAEVGSGQLAASTKEGLTVVDLTFATGGSPGGSWVLDTHATPQQVTVIDLYYFWGVGLEIRAPEGLTIGESSPLQVLLSYADGTPVDPADYQSLAVRMQVGGQDVSLVPDGPGSYVTTHDVPAQDAPAALEIGVTAEAVSSPSSVGLGPVSGSARLQTVLPPSYATLLTHELRMPQIVGLGTTSGALQFRGSERGETRVCVDDVRIAAPELAGEVTVSTAGQCLAIPANDEVTWPVELSPAGAADGRIQGSLVLSMTSVDSSDTITVEVPVGASMMRPVNEPLRWGLVAGLVLLGLLLPTAIAWLTNLLNGTFRVGPRTVLAEAPVRLTPQGLEPQARTALLTLDDFRGLGFAKESRRSRIDGPVRLTRRLPLWPFGEVRYEAVTDDGVVVSSLDPYTLKGGRRAPAVSNFGDVFFLRLRPSPNEDGSYDGLLVIVDTDDPDLSTVIRRREDQVQRFRDWSALYERLEEQVRQDVEPEPAAVATRKSASPSAPVGPGGPSDAEARPSLWDEPRSSLWEDPPTRPEGDSVWDPGADSGRSGPAPSRDRERSDKPRSIFDD
jgi:hypothetical protein